MKNKTLKTVPELQDLLAKAILDLRSRKIKNTNVVKNIRHQIAQAYSSPHE